MKHYSAYEYILIDIANAFGLDKLIFEERIEWVKTHLGELESLSGQADSQPLYKKAVMALRKAQQGLPSGHLVAMDACCSGIQIMSVLTGCIDGARATGLVDPNVRADAYTQVNKEMGVLLGNAVNVSRADTKQALMTVMYGSKAKPKEIFGEDTPEISAFYTAAQKITPGAWELLQDLLGAWQPGALEHSWQMPDGFDVKVKVMVQKEIRIEVDELNM